MPYTLMALSLQPVQSLRRQEGLQPLQPLRRQEGLQPLRGKKEEMVKFAN